MIYKNAINEHHVGNSHVYQVDCMDLLKQTPDKYYDLCVCDPPYGIGESMKKRENTVSEKWKNPYKKKHSLKQWDEQAPIQEYFDELIRVSKNQIIWGGNYFDLPPSQGFLIWDKKQPERFSSSMIEMAWMSIQSPAKMFSASVTTTEKNKIHPTQKPVKLYDWIFKNYAKEGDKILDTHLGSGSSRIAAYKAKLDFVGCD